MTLTSLDQNGTIHHHWSGEEVVFEENEQRKFTFRINGSHPAQNVTVGFSWKDITHLFTRVSNRKRVILRTRVAMITRINNHCDKKL